MTLVILSFLPIQTELRNAKTIYDLFSFFSRTFITKSSHTPWLLRFLKVFLPTKGVIGCYCLKTYASRYRIEALYWIFQSIYYKEKSLLTVIVKETKFSRVEEYDFTSVVFHHLHQYCHGTGYKQRDMSNSFSIKVPNVAWSDTQWKLCGPKTQSPLLP